MSTSTGDIRAQITNVSVGGLGLVGSRSGSTGEFVRVRFEVPVVGGVKVLNPDAVIARSARVGDQFAWALEFLSLDAAARGVLESYVELARSAPPSAIDPDEGGLGSASSDARRRAVEDLLRQQRSAVLHGDGERERRPTPAPAAPAKPRPSDLPPSASKRDLYNLFRDALGDTGGKKKK